ARRFEARRGRRDDLHRLALLLFLPRLLEQVGERVAGVGEVAEERRQLARQRDGALVVGVLLGQRFELFALLVVVLEEEAQKERRRQRPRVLRLHSEHFAVDLLRLGVAAVVQEQVAQVEARRD